MIITKDKYKEILQIQGVTYTEGSAWFETSLERINQALSLADVVGRSEQLVCYTCNCTKGNAPKGDNFCNMCDHYF
jgi:hypothetical protein